MAAGPLALRLRNPVQMDARRCVAQRTRERIEACRPAGTNESLSLDGTRVRGDEKSRALHGASLNSDIKTVTPWETPLTVSIIPVVADDDKAERRAWDPHCRARTDNDRNTTKCCGCVDTVPLFGCHLTARHRDGDAKILLDRARISRRVLAGGRNDDDAAT